MDKELTKLYYSIGEVAELFGVSQSLLRYWQTEFPKLKPKKNRKGDRKYTPKDIAYIERIYTLVKEKGFTLEGARKELNRKVTISDKDQKLLTQLQAIKKGLAELKKEID